MSRHLPMNSGPAGTGPVLRAGRRPRMPRRPARRGVASVLSMMFLVIFGSLAAAMAVVAHSNMRTADSALKVSGAMSAAETGLVIGQRRLLEQASRFVITKGVIDSSFGKKLWIGTYSDGGSDGTVDVLDPVGFTENTPPDGIIHALSNVHTADTHTISVDGYVTSPDVDEDYGVLLVPPIALTTDGDSRPFFVLRYEILADSAAVRITSTGVDGDVTRTLSIDVALTKRIEFAILAPNRIMIGKNVRIEGPLGSRYGLVAGELDPENGDPLVLRSDFYYLDSPTLDEKLDVLYSAIADFDVDGDNRLRPNHPTEKTGLSGAAYLVDYDGNEYVDDFDLFMSHYDDNNDKMVVYDAALAAAAGYGALSEEFSGIDDQLARLIDEAVADRDGDGEITSSDTGLGYQDGVLDINDVYAKVHGRLAFAVDQTSWEAAHGGSYQTVVHGPIQPDLEDPPCTFEVSDDEMLELTTAMFDDNHTWFDNKATGDLEAQAAAQDGVDGAEYIPADADTEWESVPYNAPGAYDHYQRPVYRGMTFTNVRIPEGTNALFEDCTFIGVTFIEIRTDCDHHDWNPSGAMTPIVVGPDIIYELQFPDLPLQEDIDADEIVADTRTVSNNIRFENCTFLGSLSGDKPDGYAHWRNKLQFTGSTRFYVDPADEDLAEQDDAAALISILNSISATDRTEMAKSSILMPGWSIDVGNFTNEQAVDPTETPKVKLRGTIVAGILDVRGTADVFGTLLMTFRPLEGDGPLFYGGMPDVFNTTIGYFDEDSGGMEGGDLDDIIAQGFGEITVRYNPDGLLPDGIPWPITADPDPLTYSEGGG